MNYADTTYPSNASKFVKNQLRALPFRKKREARYYNAISHPGPVVIGQEFTKNGVITTHWQSRLNNIGNPPNYTNSYSLHIGTPVQGTNVSPENVSDQARYIVENKVWSSTKGTQTVKDGVATTFWEKSKPGNVISENDSFLWTEFCAMRTLFPTLYAQNPYITFEEFKKWKEYSSPDELRAAAVIPKKEEVPLAPIQVEILDAISRNSNALVLKDAIAESDLITFANKHNLWVYSLDDNIYKVCSKLYARKEMPHKASLNHDQTNQ
jgi:hypothetical protein